jgi:hypothetical protein
MEIRFRSSMLTIALAAAVTVVAVMLSPAETEGQVTAYRAPRLVGTANPDLNGIWQAMGSAHWDIQDHAVDPGPFPELVGTWGVQPAGQSVVVGNEIPYQPWALQKKQENFDTRLTIDPEELSTQGDPEAKCMMPGVPRATYLPFPFQIIQTRNKILVAYQFNVAKRTIHMENHTEAPIDFWMGWSNGHWEGDTLVVEVTGFNGLTWLDRAGNFHSEALRVVERYTPISPHHLLYEATLEDPNVYTRPWTIRMPLYRRLEENAQLLEFRCVDIVEEFIYGSLVKQSQ